VYGGMTMASEEYSRCGRVLVSHLTRFGVWMRLKAGLSKGDVSFHECMGSESKF